MRISSLGFSGLLYAIFILEAYGTMTGVKRLLRDPRDFSFVLALALDALIFADEGTLKFF